MENTAERNLSERRLDEHRQLWIDTLSHARHDWLNDLQLLIGYVQLRKYDKLAECVDMLKQRLAEESRVSKLGHPGLVEALLTHKTRRRPYAFEVVVGHTVDLRETPGVLAAEHAVRCLLHGFEAAAARGMEGTENRLVCAMETAPSGIVIQFTYEGAYEAEALRDSVARMCDDWQGNGAALSVQEQYSVQEAQVTVEIPIAG